MACTGSGEFIVGEVVTCSCTSDIGADTVQWYREDAAVESDGSGEGAITYSSASSRLNSLTIPVTTDNQGEIYTCAISGACGKHERNVTVHATGTAIYTDTEFIAGSRGVQGSPPPPLYYGHGY